MVLRNLIFITSLFSLSFAQEIQREQIDPSLKQQAKIAVEELAAQVMKGNFLYSLDYMYPRWKERTAQQVGGKEALRKRLEAVPRQMQLQGITILDFQVGEPETAYAVNGAYLKGANQSPVFQEYMVLVPTTTIYRVIDLQAGVPKKVMTKGFQVAICKQDGTHEWTFIDGSTLKINDLAALFPFLPKKEGVGGVLFPVREMKEL